MFVVWSREPTAGLRYGCVDVEAMLLPVRMGYGWCGELLPAAQPVVWWEWVSRNGG